MPEPLFVESTSSFGVSLLSRVTDASSQNLIRKTARTAARYATKRAHPCPVVFTVEARVIGRIQKILENRGFILCEIGDNYYFVKQPTNTSTT